jgi:hypothetical protein
VVNARAEIDPIYKELTKSKEFPQGGKAYLELDKEDVRGLASLS